MTFFRTKTASRVTFLGRDSDGQASQEIKRWEGRGKAVVVGMGLRGTESGEDSGQEVVVTGHWRGQEGQVKSTSRVSSLGG